MPVSDSDSDSGSGSESEYDPPYSKDAMEAFAVSSSALKQSRAAVVAYDSAVARLQECVDTHGRQECVDAQGTAHTKYILATNDCDIARATSRTCDNNARVAHALAREYV
jgi:hypothetical protein